MKRVGDARPGNVDSLPYISKVAIESLGKRASTKTGRCLQSGLISLSFGPNDNWDRAECDQIMMVSSDGNRYQRRVDVVSSRLNSKLEDEAHGS